jgi:hypothetical protein
MQRISQQTIALVQYRLGHPSPDGVEDEFTQQAISAQRKNLGLKEGSLVDIALVRSMFNVPMDPVWANMSIDPRVLDVNGDPAWGRLFPGNFKAMHGVRGVSGSFVPHGVIVHHTAGPRGRTRINRTVLTQGRPDLRGPLVQVGVSRDGFVDFITNGRANHAGAGVSAVLENVKKNGAPIHPGDVDDAYGNSSFLGIEIDNAGVDEPYPEAQIEAAVEVVVMWCKAFGWSANRVIGHREWTRRKIDPSLDIGLFRERVRRRLK